MSKTAMIAATIVCSMAFAGKAGDKAPQNSSEPYVIDWPEVYNPEEAKFFVHNELEIQASPAVVWDILINAEAWSEWYEGASEVRVKNGSNGILGPHSVIHWKTMGMKFESEVQEFVPYERLSWESKKKSIKGYHAWLIIPTESGCKVITDESQHGWLTFFEKTFQRNKLQRLHDIWLAELRKKAEDQFESLVKKVQVYEDTL
jgi:uncharacterized protein YndB with AHSA1/START domain